MARRFLVLDLDAPMIAFGDVQIDSIGRICRTPPLAAMTGLLANALGFDRTEVHRLDALQRRIRFACRVDATGLRFTDMQTAQLGHNDKWWTTSGEVQSRGGSRDTFVSPHIRYRDFDAGARMRCLVALEDPEEAPTLDRIGTALMKPARPLFFGRKSCLPARPVFGGFVEATTFLEAFRQLPLLGDQDTPAPSHLFVRLPLSESPVAGLTETRSTEARDWVVGLHAGLQPALTGHLPFDHCASVSV